MAKRDQNTNTNPAADDPVAGGDQPDPIIESEQTAAEQPPVDPEPPTDELQTGEPPVEQPPVESEERKARKVVLCVHEASLGNGTRKRGTVMGTMADDGNITPAEGVDDVEIQNLILNPDMFVIE